jgi:L-asparaginase/Glu-tRNA(Gln) amidotransferase subunit D
LKVVRTGWVCKQTVKLHSNCIFIQFLYFCKDFFDMADSIVFLGTGGTIAGSATSAQDNLSYTSGRVALGDLLAALPGLPERLAEREMLHEQVFQEDSKDLDPSHWQLLAARVGQCLERPSVGGVVITHGTDTLEETAFFLARTLPARLLAAKPVVMTRKTCATPQWSPARTGRTVSWWCARARCSMVPRCKKTIPTGSTHLTQETMAWWV